MQVLTGTLLGLHYTPGIYSAYYSIIHIYREVYYGSLYRYVHSSVASPVFTTVCTHPYRGIFHGSYWYVYSVMWIGVAVFIVLMATAFMGYVLPWGQMSYWGATVITNLLSSIPVWYPGYVVASIYPSPPYPGISLYTPPYRYAWLGYWYSMYYISIGYPPVVTLGMAPIIGYTSIPGWSIRIHWPWYLV